MQQMSTINFIVYILKNKISDCSSTEIFSQIITLIPIRSWKKGQGLYWSACLNLCSKKKQKIPWVYFNCFYFITQRHLDRAESETEINNMHLNRKMCECHLGIHQIKDDGQTVHRKELQGQHKPKCHLSTTKGKPISHVLERPFQP